MKYVEQLVLGYWKEFVPVVLLLLQQRFSAKIYTLRNKEYSLS